MFLVLEMTWRPRSDPERPRAGPPKPSTVPAPGIEDHATHRTFPMIPHKPWAQCNIPSYQKRTGDSPIFSGEEN
jgi:hypothetical protein